MREMNLYIFELVFLFSLGIYTEGKLLDYMTI